MVRMFVVSKGITKSSFLKEGCRSGFRGINLLRDNKLRGSKVFINERQTQNIMPISQMSVIFCLLIKRISLFNNEKLKVS